MKNRRAFFGLLAAAPIAVVAEVAKAKQPTEIEVDRIKMGKYEMVHDNDKMHIRKVDRPKPAPIENTGYYQHSQMHTFTFKFSE